MAAASEFRLLREGLLEIGWSWGWLDVGGASGGRGLGRGLGRDGFSRPFRSRTSLKGQFGLLVGLGTVRGLFGHSEGGRLEPDAGGLLGPRL